MKSSRNSIRTKFLKGTPSLSGDLQINAKHIQSSSGKLERVKQNNISARVGATLWFTLVVVICLILGSRKLYITWDDANYIMAFRYSRPFEYGIWAFIIEEPLWALLTSFLGGLLNPEHAYRIVLYFSPLAFILSMNKVAGGRWGYVGLHSWVLILGFLLTQDLGARPYITLSRQGLADSIFILLVALNVRPIFAAIGGGLVHSAVLLLIPMLEAARRLAKRPTTAWAFAGVVVFYGLLLSTGVIPSPFEIIDMGRRTNTYTFTERLNFLGVFAHVILYAVPLIVLRNSKSHWYRIALLTSATCIVLAAIQPSMIRMFITLDVVFFLAILSEIRTHTGKVAASYWILSLMFLEVLNMKRDYSGLDGWLNMWKLTLGI